MTKKNKKLPLFFCGRPEHFCFDIFIFTVLRLRKVDCFYVILVLQILNSFIISAVNIAAIFPGGL